MNRKKMLLAASAVVLTVGGVFAGMGIKRATATDLYVKNPNAPACIKIASVSGGGSLSINSAFTTTAAGGTQAYIRSNGNTTNRLLFQDASCTSTPVYYKAN